MKMPEKPRSVKQILEEKRESITKVMPELIDSELLKRYNDEYLHWDQLRRRELPTDPEVVWALMKMLRRSQYINVIIGDTSLEYHTTTPSQQILHVLDTGASGYIVMSGEPLIKEEMDKYVIGSLMEEAIASSQLEGAVTTTTAAKRMLREKRKPKSPSEQMIFNNFMTMQKIKDVKNKPLTVELILELHYLTTLNTLDDPADGGRFRTDDETVVGDVFEVEKIYHQPPSFTRIQKYMQSLCDFANKDQKGEFQHPLIKAILIHYMIGYIHAFVDGNGRLARALMYWYALRNDYWLFEHMAISKVIKERKGRYLNAYLYTETDDDDVTYFINYNLECMKEALENTRKYIERKQKEHYEVQNLINQIPELNFRQAAILKDLAKHKGEPISVIETSSKYGVVPQTARTDLLLLLKLGYVEMRKMGRKLVFFYREDGTRIDDKANQEAIRRSG
ncbi:MAG: Fic family protein [Methanomassiliicoccales archaeon]